jgi:non-specific protein-tyrosine kinase
MEEEVYIDLRQYLNLLWVWKWLILVSMLLAGATAFWFSQQITPVYESSVTMRINQAPSSSHAMDNQPLVFSERLSQTYVELLQSRPILQTTIVNLGLDTTYQQLLGNITVTAIRDTQLIKLTVKHPDPQQAAAIANEIVAVFTQQEQQIQSSRYEASRENLERQLVAIEQEIAETQRDITRLGKVAARTVTQQAEYEQLQAQMSQYRTNYTSLLQSLEEVRLTEAQSTNNLLVIDPASVSFSPVSPRPMMNTLLATVVGAIWAIMVVFVKEFFDDSIRTSDQVEHLTQIPVLAHIGKINDSKDNGNGKRKGLGKGTSNGANNGIGHDSQKNPEKLITSKQSKSPIAESYRMLCANIDFAMIDHPLQTLLVTSSGPKEGKSTTVANLAAAIAQTGRKVIIVDTDLRRPTVHTFFGISNGQGLTMALMNSDKPLATYIHPSVIANLSVMPSGPIPPHPAELLGSQRMVQVVDELKGMFDVIVFDSPPALAVVDANLLARSCDATLMVVFAASTKSHVLVKAKEQLRQAGARLVGTVLNQVTKNSGGYYEYYHYYYTPGPDDSGKGDGGKGDGGKGQLVPMIHSRNGHGDAHTLERVE